MRKVLGSNPVKDEISTFPDWTKGKIAPKDWAFCEVSLSRDLGMGIKRIENIKTLTLFGNKFKEFLLE